MEYNHPVIYEDSFHFSMNTAFYYLLEHRDQAFDRSENWGFEDIEQRVASAFDNLAYGDGSAYGYGDREGDGRTSEDEIYENRLGSTASIDLILTDIYNTEYILMKFS